MDVPLAAVTVTFLAPPFVTAGVVQVMVVVEVTLTLLHARPPKLTVAGETKFVPVIVTEVPPVVGPPTGEMAETVGGLMYVKAEFSV